jgi:hypothetical protein
VGRRHPDVGPHDESAAVLATARGRHNRNLTDICRHLEGIGALRDDVDARLASRIITYYYGIDLLRHRLTTASTACSEPATCSAGRWSVRTSDWWPTPAPRFCDHRPGPEPELTSSHPALIPEYVPLRLPLLDAVVIRQHWRQSRQTPCRQ